MLFFWTFTEGWIDFLVIVRFKSSMQECVLSLFESFVNQSVNLRFF